MRAHVCPRVAAAVVFLALLATPSPPLSNCSVAPFNTYLYCDADAPIDARLADLVERLSPPQFQSLLSNGNDGVAALGIPTLSYGEALHGALSKCGVPFTNTTTNFTSSGCATSFPTPLALSRTLNRTLWQLVGAAIGVESRALHNEGSGMAGAVWTPNINLFRDVRWGRGLEVGGGECPLVSSEYAAQYIAALQGGPSSAYLLVPAQAKHTAVYDCEACDGIGRNSFDANVSRRDLVEYFYPPFRAAVQRGRVSGLLCAYTALNGFPSCVDGTFLNTIVRNAWGAGADDVVVVSDCGAIREIWKDYNFTSSNETAVAAALHGGCDMECGGTFNNYIVKALDLGVISIEDLKQAARRLLRPWIRMGLLDPPERQPYLALSARDVDTQVHRQLAFDAAVQSIVLLRNMPPLLPLRVGASMKRLALVGPNANVTNNLLGSYYGQNTLVSEQSVLASLRRRGAREGFEVVFAAGCVNISCSDASGFASAVEAAAASDVAVVVLGLCADDCPGGDADTNVGEGEGRDRSSTDLPGLQETLLRDIAATGTPTILLLIHGGSISIDWAAEYVAAIVSSVYPGELGGDALCAVLFGDASPSGRTTTTWYSSAWQRARPLITDMQLAPHEGAFGPVSGITYLYNNNASEILYEFGYGLSYTNFSFQWEAGADLERLVDARALVADPPAFAVNVTNGGNYTSDVTAMAFIRAVPGAPSEPLKKCFDFARASALAPGDSVLLIFTLPPWVIARVDSHGLSAVRSGEYSISVIGDTMGPIVRTLKVTGEDVTGPF